MSLIGRALVVDDSSAMRNVLKKLLEQKGFSVAEAQDGKFALTVENGDYELIILDIMMPEINGVDALQILRERKINTPVIVVSAVINKDMLTELVKMHINAIISKPVNINRFYIEIDKIISQNQLEP